jgi:hypothetical protein
LILRTTAGDFPAPARGTSLMVSPKNLHSNTVFT